MMHTRWAERVFRIAAVAMATADDARAGARVSKTTPLDAA